MIPKNIERRIRQHVHAKKHDFFAVVQPGFEDTALQEILRTSVLFSDVNITEGGIEFSGGIKDIWELNFSSGCLTRIIMRIAVFKALYFEKFREKTESIPWELYIKQDQVPGFSIKCRHSRLYHTGRIEEECAKGILSRMENIYSAAAQEESYAPSMQTIYVRFEDDFCTLSIDTTGEPLYRRSIRTHIAKAPMRETLASCILHEAGIENFDALLDPMCGSGVIPLEGALISKGIPAGVRRHFAFEDWPGHRKNAFDYLKRKVIENRKSCASGFSVYASDISEKAIETARYNFGSSDISVDVKISCADFFSLKRNDFPEKRLLIAFNPPYGERIGLNDVMQLYREIGIKLRSDFSGSICAVIVPGLKAEKALGISPIKRIPFVNGGIKVVLVIGLT
jgi:putative N6-adenine-specific DNA methylase